jgi:hypothetical protein
MDNKYLSRDFEEKLEDYDISNAKTKHNTFSSIKASVEKLNKDYKDNSVSEKEEIRNFFKKYETNTYFLDILNNICTNVIKDKNLRENLIKEDNINNKNETDLNLININELKMNLLSRKHKRQIEINNLEINGNKSDNCPHKDKPHYAKVT